MTVDQLAFEGILTKHQLDESTSHEKLMSTLRDSNASVIICDPLLTV